MKERNAVNLTVNPCKMCMPMGGAMAMYGIRGCMTVLHGSQGCSTYIRRHMATHYNEPIDIGSSSLTEHGTVMGGESNLVKALDNIIRLYRPEAVAVATTCLAETIGEDVPRILRDYLSIRPDCKTTLIPVSSAGFSGTHFEGYFKALRSVLETVQMDRTPNGRINVVIGPASPADVRFLKSLVRQMGLDAIFLPDISDNLDAGHDECYRKLPQKGTPLEDVRKMAGSSKTIEISSFIQDELSPAVYLKERYGVPFVRLNLPAGLRDTDALASELERCGGKTTDEIDEQRSRLLDAMIDSHKYNADGRAAVFGEPDFVYAVVRLMTENGIIPSISVSGSGSKTFVRAVSAEIERLRSLKVDMEYLVLDDADFLTIEEKVVELGVGVMVGSSDGRRIEQKYNIPLVRAAFPVHDHVGGQRLRMLGYDGCLALLDRITNSLITNVETTFRQGLYEKYYQWGGGSISGADGAPEGDATFGTGGEGCVHQASEPPPVPSDAHAGGLLVAVASKSGILVDTHFGRANDLYIFEVWPGGMRFKEHRSVGSGDGSCCGVGQGKPAPGRIAALISAASDCGAVLALRMGESPRSKLGDLGIRCVTANGRIEDEVKKMSKEMEDGI
ncbi:MAG: nitrogenase [Candidatus Methanoplasma sp.]|jgi:nitrogenase molybdenum-iron protein alpha/beta subunit/predicted Fe-Mo cluster-binding NifX family protein|nr:nitrogenase [Candidatus Methanoplasma sp.]